MRLLLMLALIGLSCQMVAADIYKWTDDKGTVVYSSTPRVANAERHYLSDAKLPTLENAPDVAQSSQTSFRQITLPVTATVTPTRTPTTSDYQISKFIEVKREKIIVSGRISSGPACKSFLIYATVRHSAGRTARLSTTAEAIGNGVLSTLYEASTSLPNPPPRPLRDWSIEEVTLRCLNPL
jgi:hypothetical protein